MIKQSFIKNYTIKIAFSPEKGGILGAIIKKLAIPPRKWGLLGENN